MPSSDGRSEPLQHRVGARSDRDRVLRVVSEADQRHAARRLRDPNDVERDTGFAQRLFHQRSECILTERQDHLRRHTAGARARDGLVRAFAAGNDRELAAQHGLAGRGHMMRAHDEVQVGRSRDQDRIARFFHGHLESGWSRTHTKASIYSAVRLQPVS